MNFMKSMYRKTSYYVKIDEKFTEWFDIITGVRKGCLLSPIIFVVVDWVMRQSVDLRDEGLMWQHSNPTDTDLADNIALLMNDKEVVMTDAVTSGKVSWQLMSRKTR